MTDSYRTAAECRAALEQLVANTERTSQRAVNYLWRLEQRIAELEAALSPFAEAYHPEMDSSLDTPIEMINVHGDHRKIRWAGLKRAYDALRKQEAP